MLGKSSKNIPSSGGFSGDYSNPNVQNKKLPEKQIQVYCLMVFGYKQNQKKSPHNWDPPVFQPTMEAKLEANSASRGPLWSGLMTNPFLVVSLNKAGPMQPGLFLGVKLR